MDVPGTAEIDDFERWNVHSLKDYLAKHGISQTGKKSELVALAFACEYMNKPESDTYTRDIQQSFHKYQDILKLLENVTLPDPFKITDGWIGERDEGMKHWPPISIADIVDHFREQKSDSDKLLSAYKARKAFDYYKTEWLKGLFYNSLNHFVSSYPGLDKYCVLKAKCTPSQRLNDPYHDMWMAIEKETGKVTCAYCNCAAGLSQTCNHVAAMLFRVEAAVRAGFTNPTCTSQKLQWNVPKDDTFIKATPISEIEIEVHKYGEPSKLGNIHEKNNSITT